MKFKTMFPNGNIGKKRVNLICFLIEIFKSKIFTLNLLQTFQNSEPLETYAVVNKTQPKKKNDFDKDNSSVIHANDPEQDPYTAPAPRDNTFDVSKLDNMD